MTRADTDALWAALQVAKRIVRALGGVTVNYGRDATDVTEAALSARLQQAREDVPQLLAALDAVDAVRIASVLATAKARNAQRATASEVGHG